MIVPCIINLMVRLYLGCRGRERFKNRVTALASILSHPFYVISFSINSAVRTLRGEEDEVEKKVAKEFKLVEIIGE